MSELHVFMFGVDVGLLLAYFWLKFIFWVT